jgi:hypothetical protein
MAQTTGSGIAVVGEKSPSHQQTAMESCQAARLSQLWSDDATRRKLNVVFMEKPDRTIDSGKLRSPKPG